MTITRCLLLIAVAFAASAQTTLPIETLRTVPWTGILVCLPPGSVPQPWCVPTVALLDSSIVLDTSGAMPILRALPVNERTLVVESPGGFTVTLPDAGYIPSSLKVYRDGLRQYSPGDFSLDGAIIVFRKSFGPHDVVVVDYRI